MTQQKTQLPNKTINVTTLPAKVLGTYAMYICGLKPRNILSKNTFYQHRKILREYSIDIDQAVDDQYTDVNRIRLYREF